MGLLTGGSHAESNYDGSPCQYGYRFIWRRPEAEGACRHAELGLLFGRRLTWSAPDGPRAMRTIVITTV